LVDDSCFFEVAGIGKSFQAELKKKMGGEIEEGPGPPSLPAKTDTCGGGAYYQGSACMKNWISNVAGRVDA